MKSIRLDIPSFEEMGEQLYQLMVELFPLHRAVTGNGVRKTLSRIADFAPLRVIEIPSGTRAFDWTIPPEWNIRDAYIKDSRGRRLIDYRASNLHVVGYSSPVYGRFSWPDLQPHLHRLPEHPDWIPYRTTCFEEGWGFCVSQHQYELLERSEGDFEVRIDSSLEAGSLTIGEVFLPGEITDEVLLSVHSCHPSLANDNLSGIAIATHLARYLSSIQHRYSYRFLFLPATIGPIAWLSQNEHRLNQIKHGLILTLLGDAAAFTYKKSRQGHSEIDRVMIQVLGEAGVDHRIVEFEPFGYDERQYCSPGINLPVGCLMRRPNGSYPEYHTSADNLDFVSHAALEGSWDICLKVISLLEGNRVYRNLNPKCEPQLGRRGLYRGYSQGGAEELQLAILWLLSLADGQRSLLEIAERSQQPFALLQQAAELLLQHTLLEDSKDPAHAIAGLSCGF